MGLLAAITGVACSGASVAGDDTGIAPLVGEWRGLLLTRGGELPFRFRVYPEGERPAAVVVNGDAETPVWSVTRQGAGSYSLIFAEDRESELVAKLSPDGDELSGYWRVVYETPPLDTAPDIDAVQMPFSARKRDQRRFQRNDPTLALPDAEAAEALAEVTGTWAMTFAGERLEQTTSGSFEQDGERVTTSAMELAGARLTMEGIYRNGLLRLSVFDGHLAALLHARATTGGALEGTLWILDRIEARVSARR